MNGKLVSKVVSCLSLVVFLVTCITSALTEAASYQKTDGTIVDPIWGRTNGDLNIHPYTGPNLEPNANLTGADLTEANLFDANLHEADLMSADLTDAFLSHANLNNANLTNSPHTTQRLVSLLRLIRDKEIRVLNPGEEGRTLTLGSVEVIVFPRRPTYFGNENNNSIGLRVVHGDVSVLHIVIP